MFSFGESTEGIYVSVNGGELKKVPGSTKLKELVGEDVKGVRTGYAVRGREALELTVAEANIFAQVSSPSSISLISALYKTTVR